MRTALPFSCGAPRREHQRPDKQLLDVQMEGFIHTLQKGCDRLVEPTTVWVSPGKNRGTASDGKIETAVPILLLIALLGSLLSLAFSD